MKKTRIIATVLVVIFLFTLTACGSKSLSGKYVVTDISGETDGMSFSDIQGMAEMLGMDLSEMIALEFKDGGTFTMTMYGESIEGTYTRKGNNLTLTVEDEPAEATIKGNTIIMESEGVKMEFTKK